MEILRHKIALVWIWSLCSLIPTAAAAELELHPGLSATTVYSIKSPAPMGLAIPYDLDVDPLTGHVYIANGATIGTAEGGNILSIDPATGRANAMPFFSQALAFAPDGTMYFGVGYFMLGAWFRDIDRLIKKFAIIPAIRGVEVGADGKLYVAEGNFGPRGLYPDAVLEVDRGDGYFQPVWSTETAETQLGKNFDVMTSLAVDAQGNIYAGFHSGELVKKRKSGEYVELRQLHGLLGGLNEFSLCARGDQVFQYDLTTGQVFAWGQDENPRLIAYGPALRASKSSSGGIAVTDRTLYLTGDYGALYAISTAGASISAAIGQNLGTGRLSGTIIDLFTHLPISGAQIRLNTGAESQSDDLGHFNFEGLPVGIYEVEVRKTDFRTSFTNQRVTTDASAPVEIALNPGLPEFVGPGLIAEIVASQANDGIAGSSDVVLDQMGALYSMNYATSTITKHSFDPVTLAPVGSRIFARGGKLGNSFITSVDGEFNVYASHGNDGVIRLPQTDGTESYQLTNDPSDATRVTDQFGVNRVISLVRDVDGIGVLSDGRLAFSSGSGGSASPGFPEGTTNTIVMRERSGAERVFSRGVNVAGETLFRNNDICKVDEMDRLLVGTATGNLVRIDGSGNAELIWPGNGAGKPEGLGAFSSVASDGQGHLFVRGALDDGSALAVRMIAPDGQSLIMAASGINQDFGGIAFSQDGKSLYISDDKLIIRIRSINEMTIAENLLQSPANAAAHTEPPQAALPTPDSGPSTEARPRSGAY